MLGLAFRIFNQIKKSPVSEWVRPAVRYATHMMPINTMTGVNVVIQQGVKEEHLSVPFLTQTSSWTPQLRSPPERQRSFNETLGQKQGTKTNIRENLQNLWLRHWDTEQRWGVRGEGCGGWGVRGVEGGSYRVWMFFWCVRSCLSIIKISILYQILTEGRSVVEQVMKSHEKSWKVMMAADHSREVKEKTHVSETWAQRTECVGGVP